MEGHCSTGQSPQWAAVPMEEKEEEEEEDYEHTVLETCTAFNKLIIKQVFVYQVG